MKHLVLALTLITSNYLGAQTYTLTTNNEPYVELTGATDLTGGQLWDDEVWTAPIGFNMELFDSTFTSLTVNSNGYIIDAIGGAEVMIGLSRTDLVDGAFLIDFNFPIPVTYLTEGVAGSQIFKLEWKLANVWGADSTNVVNYQIWMYEATGNVELRFGDGFLSNMGTLSIQKKLQDPFFEDGFSLKGDPLNPQTSNLINQEVDDYPVDGTVYTFVRGANPTTIEENENTLSVYPNPTTDYVMVSGLAIGTNYTVLNNLGQVVLSNAYNGSIELSSLPSGYYSLVADDLKETIVKL